MSIQDVLRGDYESAVLGVASASSKGLSDFGQKLSQALKERMSGQGKGGEAQHTRDSHGQGQDANNGREAQQRQNPNGFTGRGFPGQ